MNPFIVVLIAVLLAGMVIALAVLSGMKAPVKNTRGRLCWHGDYLEDWSEV